MNHYERIIKIKIHILKRKMFKRRKPCLKDHKDFEFKRMNDV